MNFIRVCGQGSEMKFHVLFLFRHATTAHLETPTIARAALQARRDGDSHARQRAQSFCEHLEKKILPYLAPLMTKLVELLMTGSLKVQETATAAITSAATAVIMAASAGDVEIEVFHPYVAQIMPVFKQIMTTTTPNSKARKW